MRRLAIILGLCACVAVAPEPGVAADDTPYTLTSEGQPGFFKRLFNAYRDEFKEPSDSGPDPARRALAAPFDSPPYPTGEYQGFPLVGVPYNSGAYPLMQAIYGGPYGEEIKASRIKLYGWLNASGNWTTNKNSNIPTSYWIFPNQPVLNQLVVRLERELDTVQTDHIDWGFRSTILYGTDYRYMTSGGWFSDQLLKHNQMYGFDPTEQYVDLYIPKVAQGLILTAGRWIATPDIETQFGPDNYLGTHSILFTVDTYTQTGVMATLMLNKNWTIQAALHAGTDMAPWYEGATPTGMLGVRWVSDSNKDSVYLVLNSINDAKFRRFRIAGQDAGHDNFNYLVGTWQHTFTPGIHTKTEGYFMWQRDAVVGGTPSLGPVKSFGGGGGIGRDIPGVTYSYGIVNYTMFETSRKSFFTVRNEWFRDEDGERTGFATNYSSHTVGFTYQLSPSIMVRPEVGYYHSYNAKAFDLGKKDYAVIGGLDVTLRF